MRLDLPTAPSLVRGEPQELTLEDVQRLKTCGPVGHHSMLARMKEKHHRLAQLLAAGFTHQEISRITGYSAQWISTLAGTPAFRALIKNYRKNADRRMDALLTKVQAGAEELLSNLLDVAKDEKDLDKIRKALEGLLDRGGLPAEANINTRHQFSLQDIKSQADHGEVIDVEAEEHEDLEDPDPTDRVDEDHPALLAETADEGPDPSASRGDSVSEEAGEGAGLSLQGLGL